MSNTQSLINSSHLELLFKDELYLVLWSTNGMHIGVIIYQQCQETFLFDGFINEFDDSYSWESAVLIKSLLWVDLETDMPL